MEKKFRLWMLLPVLIAVVLLLALFRETILIYAFPKAVLSSALDNTASQLKQRFQNSPLLLFSEPYNREGRYTAQVALETSNDFVGSIRYDLTVQTDASGHQISAEGVAGFSGKELEMSVYLNDRFLAFSSEELLNGKYYGITYDTFSSDLDKFPLVKRLLPNTTMNKWENSISELQALMNRSREIPEITGEDLGMLVSGVLLLDSHVSRAETQINGSGMDCYKITYHAVGEEVEAVLSYILNTDGADYGEITAEFYLHEGAVVKLEIYGAAGENDIHCDLTLGENALTDDLTLQEKRLENGESSEISVTAANHSAGKSYTEVLNVDRKVEELAYSHCISYDWDNATGDMLLKWNDTDIHLNLTQGEDGLCIVTEDFAQLWAELIHSEKKPIKEISGTVTLTGGSEVREPDYKNLDQWSVEDLLTLLGGIGTLIGLRIG